MCGSQAVDGKVVKIFGFSVGPGTSGSMASQHGRRLCAGTGELMCVDRQSLVGQKGAAASGRFYAFLRTRTGGTGPVERG